MGLRCTLYSCHILIGRLEEVRMGCDGGSIPKRADLVKTKGRNAKLDETEMKLARWRYCALSKEPLRSPIVTCKQGRLYNKEAIIKHLLNNTTFGDGATICEHIRKLKDVTSISLTANVDFNEKDNGSAPFVCPVTGKEMNGSFPFIYLKGCGCVMSRQALSEIKSDTCLKCGKSRVADDVIPLNQSTSTSTSTAPVVIDRKRPAPIPTNPTEQAEEQDDYFSEDLKPSFSGISTFRKTSSISQLYSHK